MKTTFTRALSLFLAFACLLFAVPVIEATAADRDDDDWIGGFHVVYNNSYKGYIIDDCSLINDAEIVIPETVVINGSTIKIVGIADMAFGACENLKTIYIPSNIKKDCISNLSFLTGGAITAYLENKMGKNPSLDEVMVYITEQMYYAGSTSHDAQFDARLEYVKSQWPKKLNALSSELAGVTGIGPQLNVVYQNLDKPELEFADEDAGPYAVKKNFPLWLAGIPLGDKTNGLMTLMVPEKSELISYLDKYIEANPNAGLTYKHSYVYVYPDSSAKLYYNTHDANGDDKIDNKNDYLEIIRYEGSSLQKLVIPGDPIDVTPTLKGMKFGRIKEGAFAKATMLNTVEVPDSIVTIRPYSIGFVGNKEFELDPKSYNKQDPVENFVLISSGNTKTAQNYAKRTENKHITYISKKNLPYISPADVMTLFVGKTEQLKVENYTGEKDKILWNVSADPEGCVTVDANGRVFAQAVGTATVTAYLSEGDLSVEKIPKCYITVEYDPNGPVITTTTTKKPSTTTPVTTTLPGGSAVTTTSKGAQVTTTTEATYVVDNVIYNANVDEVIGAVQAEGFTSDEVVVNGTTKISVKDIILKIDTIKTSKNGTSIEKICAILQDYIVKRLGAAQHASLDISMVYRSGKTEKKIYTLDTYVNMKIKLKGVPRGKKPVVGHFNEDYDTVEPCKDVSYDHDEEILSFKTNSFSPFAIGLIDDAASVTTTTTNSGGGSSTTATTVSGGGQATTASTSETPGTTATSLSMITSVSVVSDPKSSTTATSIVVVGTTYVIVTSPTTATTVSGSQVTTTTEASTFAADRVIIDPDVDEVIGKVEAVGFPSEEVYVNGSTKIPVKNIIIKLSPIMDSEDGTSAEEITHRLRDLISREEAVMHAAVDISLVYKVGKIEKEITSLDSYVHIKLRVKDIPNGKRPIVYHYDKESNSIEPCKDVSFDRASKILSFKANEFSPFAIGLIDAPLDPVVTTTTNTTSGDTSGTTTTATAANTTTTSNAGNVTTTSSSAPAVTTTSGTPLVTPATTTTSKNAITIGPIVRPTTSSQPTTPDPGSSTTVSQTVTTGVSDVTDPSQGSTTSLTESTRITTTSISIHTSISIITEPPSTNKHTTTSKMIITSYVIITEPLTTTTTTSSEAQGTSVTKISILTSVSVISNAGSPTTATAIIVVGTTYVVVTDPPVTTTSTTSATDPTTSDTGDISTTPTDTSTTPTETSISVVTTAVFIGDANEDGKVDVRDCAHIARMLAYGMGDKLPYYSDFNKDGKVDVRDAAAIARQLANNADIQWEKIFIIVKPNEDKKAEYKPELQIT